MTIPRIRIDCVPTDPFGLSATRITDYLLSDEPFDEAKCRSLIDHRVKASPDEIMDAVHRYHILEEQKYKMTHAKAHMDFINKSIDETEAEMFLRSRQYDSQIKQIATIPGITELSALFILSEIGSVYPMFQSRKEPYFAIKYQRIAKRRGKKKAIIAIARMMLTGIYHMLTDNKDFHPDDYEATGNPPRQKPVVLNLSNTLQFLSETELSLRHPLGIYGRRYTRCRDFLRPYPTPLAVG